MEEKQAGYKYLKTFQLATIIYDLTFKFCNKFLAGRDFVRMREQMVHAGRSGKQNIAEGYLEKSLKMYIKLAGVSRASFGELLEDYEDFLRQRDLALWSKDDPRVKQIRGLRLSGESGQSGRSDSPNIPDLPDNPESAANMLITLLHQENYLLDMQLASLEEKFINEGGWSEKLFSQRMNKRNNQ
jgi:four helix bundle suffix protein